MLNSVYTLPLAIAFNDKILSFGKRDHNKKKLLTSKQFGKKRMFILHCKYFTFTLRLVDKIQVVSQRLKLSNLPVICNIGKSNGFNHTAVCFQIENSCSIRLKRRYNRVNAVKQVILLCTFIFMNVLFVFWMSPASASAIIPKIWFQQYAENMHTIMMTIEIKKSYENRFHFRIITAKNLALISLISMQISSFLRLHFQCLTCFITMKFVCFSLRFTVDCFVQFSHVIIFYLHSVRIFF